MPGSWELRTYSRMRRGRADSFLVLCRASDEETFIERMRSKHPDALDMLVTAAVRSGVMGLAAAERARLVTRLDGSLCLYELKSRGSVWRMLAYMHPSGPRRVVPVMLTAVRGHQGKTARLPSAVVEAARRLAVIAGALMKEGGRGSQS